MSQHRDRDEQAMRDYLAGRGEDLYRQRFQALVESRGRGLDGYSPLADLVGAMPYRPLPEATEPWIDAQTRAQLEALAASTNTAALLRHLRHRRYCTGEPIDPAWAQSQPPG